MINSFVGLTSRLERENISIRAKENSLYNKDKMHYKMRQVYNEEQFPLH
jgi:hypothetical protein